MQKSRLAHARGTIADTYEYRQYKRKEIASYGLTKLEDWRYLDPHVSVYMTSCTSHVMYEYSYGTIPLRMGCRGRVCMLKWYTAYLLLHL
jgi:hypothetical protein